MSYNDIITNHINKNEASNEIAWRFQRIVGHSGPHDKNSPYYMGSTYNVQVEFQDGSINLVPLDQFRVDNPVPCAIDAKEKGLLDLPGWRIFRNIAKHAKKLQQMANQAKLRSFNTSPKYIMYGYEIPKNYKHAVFLDHWNRNTFWQDTAKLKFSQLFEYSTFDDKGHIRLHKPPEGYRRIRYHLIFAVKHDGRHKVRCVADGHLTAIPIDSVYSGVITFLRGLRIMIFLLDEHNTLILWVTDVGNVYLKAETKERIYIIAGPEFGDLEGHILIILKKALYGLQSFGKQWHERFADCLRAEGFVPCCKVEPDLWIRRCHDGSCYKMIGVYVDNLALGMKDPKAFLDILTTKYKFKLKGSGPIQFHLGCDFKRDNNGTLVMYLKQYIEQMVSQYKTMFGTKPKTTVTSPLVEKGDHPEIDDTDLLDSRGSIQQYQSIIGLLQWAVSLGRFDITTAVMTMSSFRVVPR